MRPAIVDDAVAPAAAPAAAESVPKSSAKLTTPPARLPSVLDALRQHVVLLAADGTVLQVNQAWRDFGMANGASPEHADAVGSNYLEASRGEVGGVVDPSATTMRDGLSAVLAGQLTAFEAEYPCHGPLGPRWFLMRCTPMLGPDGGAVVTHEDITARWLLEQQRDTLIAELTQANRELSEFAYVVSHDLKAPLRGISSLTSWLITDHAQQLGPKGAQHVTMIGGRVKRLAAMIDAILAYSRAGRSRMPAQPVEIGALVHNIVELLAPAPHITIQVARDLPTLVVEPVRMQQVFQNLLSNAFDFIDKPEGRVAVTCVREQDRWHFSVADNGAGIEARHFSRIFQLFKTLTARDEQERTGVGLALAKKIVEAEGGRIWVESVVGEGTLFHFTWPAEPCPSAQASTTWSDG